MVKLYNYEALGILALPEPERRSGRRNSDSCRHLDGFGASSTPAALNRINSTIRRIHEDSSHPLLISTLAFVFHLTWCLF